MHQVAVLALHDFVPFDLGIACEVFGRVSLANGAQAYDVKVYAQTRTIRARFRKLVGLSPSAFRQRFAPSPARREHAMTIAAPSTPMTTGWARPT
jgi:hypothetical protein